MRSVRHLSRDQTMCRHGMYQESDSEWQGRHGERGEGVIARQKMKTLRYVQHEMCMGMARGAGRTERV